MSRAATRLTCRKVSHPKIGTCSGPLNVLPLPLPRLQECARVALAALGTACPALAICLTKQRACSPQSTYIFYFLRGLLSNQSSYIHILVPHVISLFFFFSSCPAPGICLTCRKDCYHGLFTWSVLHISCAGDPPNKHRTFSPGSEYLLDTLNVPWGRSA